MIEQLFDPNHYHSHIAPLESSTEAIKIAARQELGVKKAGDREARYFQTSVAVFRPHPWPRRAPPSACSHGRRTQISARERDSVRAISSSPRRTHTALATGCPSFSGRARSHSVDPLPVLQPLARWAAGWGMSDNAVLEATPFPRQPLARWWLFGQPSRTRVFRYIDATVRKKKKTWRFFRSCSQSSDARAYIGGGHLLGNSLRPRL